MKSSVNKSSSGQGSSEYVSSHGERRGKGDKAQNSCQFDTREVHKVENINTIDSYAACDIFTIPCPSGFYYLK